MKVIERPIGIKNRFVEITFTILDTADQVKNIIKTHVGWTFVHIQNSINPDSLQPIVLFMLVRPEANTQQMNFGKEFYEVPLECIIDAKDILEEYELTTIVNGIQHITKKEKVAA